MGQTTTRRSIRTLAQELAVIAHARALHAVHPILRLGSPRHRDVVYQCLAEEFREMEASVEELLRRSKLVAHPTKHAGRAEHRRGQGRPGLCGVSRGGMISP